MQSPYNPYLNVRLLWVGLGLGLSTLFVSFTLASSVQAAVLRQTLPPRFVNEQGVPLANVQLRLLCYAARDGIYLLTHNLVDSTTAQGQLVHPLPVDCERIAVMQTIHQQPAGKPGRVAAYTVYNTSWPAGSVTLAVPGGDVIVRSDQHLVLFNVAVALEWELPANSLYRAELEEGLRLASTYLYDVTDGQMAFGVWQITAGGQGWDSADIRIRAANDYRPSAQVGGIVAVATPYTAANGLSTLYTPGAILVGRYWDGNNAADPINGAWTQPAAYRTLVHEWLHYALFLYDEYQDMAALGRAETYCSCSELPQVGQNPAACGQVDADLAASVMAYHYTASELWLDGNDASCQASEQFHVHGASDWETLARWGTIQGLPSNWLRKPTGVIAGPPLGNLAGIRGASPEFATDSRLYLPWLANTGSLNAERASSATTATSPAIQTASAITVQLSVDAFLTLTELQALQVQIYTWEPVTATQPARVLYQGTTTGQRQLPNHLGQAALVGIQPGTQVAVFIAHPGAAPATHYVYYGPLDPALEQQSIQARVDPAPLSLDVAPGLADGDLHTLHLTLSSDRTLPVPPVAQLCTPDAAIGCPQNSTWHQVMVGSSAGITWTATISAPPNQPLPTAGILWISTGDGAIFRWYETLGGVGPARIRTDAPRRDGLMTVDGAEGFAGGESQVFVMPTANRAALQAALPLGVSGVFGSPFEVKVLLPNPAATQGVAASSQPAATLAAPVLISMFYDGLIAEQLNLKLNQSQLLQYQPTRGRWQIIAPAGQSGPLTWVASRPLTDTGILAVGRMTSPDFGLKPEMFAVAGALPNLSPIRVQIVVPTAATLITPTAATVRTGVPLLIGAVAQVTCNIGTCEYADEVRQVVWQGDLQKGDLLLLSFALTLDPKLPPIQLPARFTLQATAFDGAVQHLLTTTVPLLGSSDNGPAPTPPPREITPPLPSASE